MTFIRWVFYDDVGTVQSLVMQKGDFKYIPASVMAAALDLDSWNVMEWTTPDSAVEAAFAETDADGKARRVNVSVDVSGDKPRLIFEYEAIEEASGDDPYEIIDILTREAAADG